MSVSEHLRCRVRARRLTVALAAAIALSSLSTGVHAKARAPSGSPTRLERAKQTRELERAKQTREGERAKQTREGERARQARERERSSTKSTRHTPATSPKLTAEAAGSLGSLSIGHPHAGYLMNAVRMPAGEEWSIGLPEHAYGTDETIAALVHCIRRVAQQYPNTPRIAVGSISAERGGPLPPHKSHRTGRDADVALYYKDGKWRWDAPAGAHNLDTERTWAFLRTLITESDVEFVLIDNVVLTLLEEHALSIGEDAAWVHELFHGDGSPYSALVKHAPGHTAHMHVRFVSPLSRERARLAYDKLVEQGHVLVPVRDIEHKVVAGETLTDIARRYGTTVSAIRALNRFDGDSVEAGRLLRVAERQDVRGARDSVVVPPRKLPRQPTPQGEVSRTPAVAATATRKGGSRYSDDEEGKLRRELDELERQLSAGE